MEREHPRPEARHERDPGRSSDLGPERLPGAGEPQPAKEPPQRREAQAGAPEGVQTKPGGPRAE